MYSLPLTCNFLSAGITRPARGFSSRRSVFGKVCSLSESIHTAVDNLLCILLTSENIRPAVFQCHEGKGLVVENTESGIPAVTEKPVFHVQCFKSLHYLSPFTLSLTSVSSVAVLLQPARLALCYHLRLFALTSCPDPD